jgi:hypothetical protein
MASSCQGTGAAAAIHPFLLEPTTPALSSNPIKAAIIKKNNRRDNRLEYCYRRNVEAPLPHIRCGAFDGIWAGAGRSNAHVPTMPSSTTTHVIMMNLSSIDAVEK